MAIDDADVYTIPLPLPKGEITEMWIPQSFGDLVLMQPVTIPEKFGRQIGKVEFITYDYCVIRFSGEVDMIEVCTDIKEIREG